MSEITSVEPQKKDAGRCNVYVDGRFYCGIKLEVAIKYHLKAGMRIDKSRLDEIQFETEKSQALDKAMTHLSATMKTEKQMLGFLTKKGYTQPVCDYVMEKLSYYGLIDDYAYCRAYVNSVQGKGKRAVERDLIRRGASKSAVEAALDGMTEDGDEIFRLLEKYLRGKQRNKENLYKGLRYLLSKGYEYDAAKEALGKFGEIDEDSST